jgi:hypothetical protein
MATHRIIPQRGPRRALPDGLTRTSNVLPIIIARSSAPALRMFRQSVQGFGDSVDNLPASFLSGLSAEQAALTRRAQDVAIAAGVSTLTSAQKSALADEANRAQWVTRYEGYRATAINNYNAATTNAQRLSYASQIAGYNKVISQQLPLLVAASQKLTTLGIAPSAAAVIASYANGDPVTTSGAAIPGTNPPPLVGTLPLGLPGQQPAANNNAALIDAMQSANLAIVVPSSTPANVIAAGNTYVGGQTVLAPGIQSSPPTILQTPASMTGGPSGLPTLNPTPGRIDSMPPASQLFTDSGIRQTSPGQAGPTGDQLAGNAQALAAAPAGKQLIPGLDNKITLIGGALLLILLLKH